MSLVLRKSVMVTDLAADPDDPFALYQVPAGTPLSALAGRTAVLRQLHVEHFADNGDGATDAAEVLSGLNTAQPSDR